MKLTHEAVRAALAKSTEWLDEFPHSELAMTTRALCEEWLARRTVRWDEGDLVNGSDHAIGYVLTDYVDKRAMACFGDDAETMHSTIAEASAWLEAKAREAGYEIEGGAT